VQRLAVSSWEGRVRYRLRQCEFSDVRVGNQHLIIREGYSGPTVERGLAALDTLFELKEQIPGLITASDKSAAEGELGWRHDIRTRSLIKQRLQLGTLSGFHRY
jgi:hypothetical protein